MIITERVQLLSTRVHIGRSLTNLEDSFGIYVLYSDSAHRSYLFLLLFSALQLFYREGHPAGQKSGTAAKEGLSLFGT